MDFLTASFSQVRVNQIERTTDTSEEEGVMNEV